MSRCASEYCESESLTGARQTPVRPLLAVKKVLFVVACVAAGILNLVVLSAYLRHRQSRLLAQPPAHGVSAVIEIGPADLASATAVAADLKETLRRRASKFGTRIYWEPISSTNFRVAAPLIGSAAAAFTNVLTRRGLLELRLVHPQNDSLADSNLVPPGYERVATTVAGHAEKLLLKRNAEPGLTGSIVKIALASRDAGGNPQIMFQLKPGAASAFHDLTRAYVGQRLAIILDGRVVSAPRIVAPIDSGNGAISGDFSPAEAVAIACMLETPLPVPVRIFEVKEF